MPATLSELLHEAARELLAARASETIDEARLEAELLYGEAAGLDRAHVIGRGGRAADADSRERFDALLRRRLEHEPLAYILGAREFYGLTFAVGPGVLIPRPETETLVEATLAAVREHPNARRHVRVADLGTGSGAVALAIARHVPNATVTGIDASSAALVYAGRNRERLGLRERVVLLAGSLLEPLTEPVDVLTANLPYVPTAECDDLAPEIRDWEPREAIDGGPDGLDAIRAAIQQLPSYVAEGPAAALFELDPSQAKAAAALLAQALDGSVTTHKDLSGAERVVEVRRGY